MRKSTVFDGQRGLVTSIFVASLFVNILVLAVPLYMLQLFARVLSSGSVPTLIALSVGAMIALLFYFVFDAIRQRLISRLGTRLEADLGPTVLTVMIQSSSATDRRGTRPIADLHEIRRFVTGPSFTALLDAPWSLLFLAVIFMFSPVLGWISTAGILLLLGMGILSELTGRKPDEQAAEASKSANDIVGELLRNADVGADRALAGLLLRFDDPEYPRGRPHRPDKRPCEIRALRTAGCHSRRRCPPGLGGRHLPWRHDRDVNPHEPRGRAGRARDRGLAVPSGRPGGEPAAERTPRRHR